MDFSIARIHKVFKVYQGQMRLAELTKKRFVNSIQGQVDRVTISEEARRKMDAGRARNLQASAGGNAPKRSSAAAKTPVSAPATPES